MQYHTILSEYMERYAIPAMLKEGWAFKAAKSYAWKRARRGPEYHVDQPLRTHILNGAYALTRVLQYLADKGHYRMREEQFKRTLVLYTLHDAYKDSTLAKTRRGSSEFDVPLSELEALIERMRLRDFADVTAEDIRAASVSLLSPKVADLSKCTPGTSHLLTFVHLADAFASQQTARDFSTAENRIREISQADAHIVRQEMRMSKRTGITSQASALPELQCYYHELDDYRGLSTLLIHQATEEALKPYGLYPILYFANGILYLGPKDSEIDTETLRETIATHLFSRIKNEAGDQAYTVADEACQNIQRLKFRKDVFLFGALEQLLQVVQDRSVVKKPAGFLAKIVAKRVEKKKYRDPDEFYDRFSIPLNADAEEAFAERWNAAYTILMGIENIAEALRPVDDTLEWLCSTFHTPSPVTNAILEHSAALRDGGVADHCAIIAYHWLVSARFSSDNRVALEVPTSDVRQKLSRQALKALTPYDKEERRLAFVNEELGLQGDVADYLHTYLTFSFKQERYLDDNRQAIYERARTRSHKPTCVICNRDIPAEMKSNVIITDIAGQQALVFSNKLQPSEEVKSSQMRWCPMCYLEFMLRKLSGQSYPAGSDYTSSYRLHLYVLPDYSFTPQLWEYASRQLLRNFEPKKTIVSKLPLRGSKDDPALPTCWLLRRTVDGEWLEQVCAMFAKQAEYLKTPTKEGKARKYGDRLTFSFKNPNYTLITYDNVVAEKADKSLVPTRVEVWTKALYAATLIHLLTGARVYITDKPYLSITRPEQMKTIIEMEGLHPLLHGLIPMARSDTDEMAEVGIRPSESSARLPIAALPTMLDLLAAVWEINAGLHQGKVGERRNLDKQVATILEEINTNYLAGATLYKMRERDQAAPYAAFTRACRILLPRQGDIANETRSALYAEGYELMLDKEGGDLMNLAEKITLSSLQLYRPSTREKGRAHRLENLFRTGVEAIKNNASSSEDEDELIARVAGTVLKRLERVIDGGEYSPAWKNRTYIEVSRTFATILVKDLFGKVCGRSVTKLTHEENHLADAVYFLSFEKITLFWEEYRKQHPASTNGATDDELLADDDRSINE